MDKAYDHKKFEDTIYNDWEQSGKMKADANSAKEPFTIVLPPPNVTGQLHLGHAAMLAIEDIIIRHQKMSGKEVCWIPGTDHAAIATENVVIKHLGIKSREELSREEFLKECQTFAAEKHDRIVFQMKKMGAWLDWSREAYTFDEKRNFAVNTIFEQLYSDELIVRGHRLINWSVGAQSVLADDEVEWGEAVEPFYYIKCGEFIIGTVRPEVKCANSPLVVNPSAEYVRVEYTDRAGFVSRYILVKNCWENEAERAKIFNLQAEGGDWKILETIKGSDLAGREFEAETYAGNRKFIIIADKVVDPQKGSGAMTVSCNHSADDYDMGKRLGLDEYFFDKIDFAGNMKKVAGSCAGMAIKDARKKSGKLMEEMGLLTGVDKKYSHRVPLCYRSGCVVEPMVSPQWFISVEKEFSDKFTGQTTTLKKLTQEAVRDQHVKIIPARFEKQYFNWVDNLRDWCISRQIWWGHQIPVFYCQDCQAENVFDAESTKNPANLACKKCQSTDLRQDKDTLDTWFSSALWPFSTLGWPDNDAADLAKFYPNNIMETGHDILTFWVLRMIMFGRYATGKYPFETVYLHGLVCDEKGKKMSKSKGNGIDPLEVIEEVGADAVRLSLVIGTAPGNNIPIGKNKIKGFRNFVNKLWNAGRFVQMQQTPKSPYQGTFSVEKPSFIPYEKNLTLFAKANRKNPTEAETAMQQILLEKFPQKFHFQKPLYRFIADFYCSELMLVIEIDGEIHKNQTEYDEIRTEYLEEFGIEVVRFKNKEVLNNKKDIIIKLKNLIEKRKKQSTFPPDKGARGLSLADKWIADRFTQISREINQHLNKYEISIAGDKIYHFVWDEFCDWYLEAHKVNPNPLFLKKIFLDILKIAHPLVPFITEELWKNLADSDEFIIDQDFPLPEFTDTKSREIFDDVQSIIGEIRRVRGENKVNPKDTLNIKFAGDIDPDALKLIEHLAKVVPNEVDEKQSTQIFAGNAELLIEIPVDEKAVAAEIKKLESQISGLKNRLSNNEYVQSAPEKLVAESRENLAQAEQQLAKLQS